MAAIIEQFKVLSLPPVCKPNAIYYVKNGTELLHYVTDSSGTPIEVSNIGLIRAIVNSAIANIELPPPEAVIVDQVTGEELIGVKNGINYTFTTSVPFVAQSTKVYKNGQRLHRGSDNDYIEAAPNQITFIYIVNSTDQIIIDYIKIQ